MRKMDEKESNININKPIKRGKMITVEGGRKFLALFKYERLSNFYYICGRLDHKDFDCEVSVNLQNKNNKAQREYGSWM